MAKKPPPFTKKPTGLTGMLADQKPTRPPPSVTPPDTLPNPFAGGGPGAAAPPPKAGRPPPFPPKGRGGKGAP